MQIKNLHFTTNLTKYIKHLTANNVLLCLYIAKCRFSGKQIQNVPQDHRLQTEKKSTLEQDGQAISNKAIQTLAQKVAPRQLD